MEDPVESAAEGTAESTPEETPAESIETADTDDSVAAADDNADGEVSDGEEGVNGKSDVKYSRFRNVNERRKAAEEENRTLKAKIAELQPKPPAEIPKTTAQRLKNVLKPAPADMSGLQQMELYTLEALEAHLPEMFDRLFEQRMGLKPDAAAATLQHATQSSRQTIVSQFQDAAKSHGLDPANSALREAVGALMDTGRFKTFGEAMDAFKPTIQTKPQPPRINGRGAEVDTVDLAGLSRVNVLPRTAKEAHTLAAAGKRIAPVSVVDILNATQKNGS